MSLSAATNTALNQDPSMAVGYGPRVHVWGIDPSQLPAESATAAQLSPFLESIFSEAIPFIEDVPAESDSAETSSASSWQPKKTYHFDSSEAPVYLFEHKLNAEGLRATAKEHRDILPQVEPHKVSDETWFLRRSTHRDAAERKTASYAEFREHFKEHHAESELAFTDTVVKTTPRREWDCAGVELQIGNETWVDWTLKLEESVHKLPFPLKKRVFPVLQATAAVKGHKREFMLVQIAFAGGPAEENERGTVTAAYTSVERVREVGDGGQVEWVMGTASDAKGILPEFVQVLAVPDAVAKDVNIFMAWIADQRKK